MPAGYSGTPLWKKLGYKTGQRVFVDGEPDGYRSMLELPSTERVVWLTKRMAAVDLVHLFAVEVGKLERELAAWRRRVNPNGAIWVSWPKRTSKVPTNITEDRIRELARPLGLVDVKVCAVDEIWSGLKLVVRKELR